MIREDSSAEKLKSRRGGSSSCFTKLSKTREFPGLPQRLNDAMIKEKKKTLQDFIRLKVTYLLKLKHTGRTHRPIGKLPCATDMRRMPAKFCFTDHVPRCYCYPFLNSLDLNTVLNCSINQDILPLTAVAPDINSVLQKYTCVRVRVFDVCRCHSQLFHLVCMCVFIYT